VPFDLPTPLPFGLEAFRPRLAQLARYAAVSVVANATTLTVLGILVGIVNFDAGWSNIIATAVATIPSFELNRRWVWGKQGQRSMSAEVVPFWVWAFLELAISSFTVHLMGEHATAAGWSRSLRTLVLEATTIGTTGALWAVQFVLFDRVLFRHRGGALPVAPGVGGEVAAVAGARADGADADDAGDAVVSAW
jgi:putative flippase GtrA